MRIVTGGIHTECSTYSPLLQTEADFTVVDGSTLAAELAPLAPAGITLAGLFQARSVPGGALTAGTYRAFKQRLLDALEAAPPADGVFLPLHGAMHVENLDDPEGDLLSAVRALVGPDMPLAVSYDLHGNVTQAVVDAIDIFAAFRTAPHIDVMETHARALTMLADTIANGTQRFVGWAPVPVLWPGERTSTDDEPALSLYAQLPDHDAKTGVCDANLMVGYVWADTPRATAASVVTGTDRDAVARSAQALARTYWDARGDFAFGMTALPLAAAVRLAAAAETGPAILADSGDNPTGGGVGDRADALAELIAQGVQGAAVVGIADAPAALKAADTGVGGTCALKIGASLGSNGPVVEAKARVERIVGSLGAGDIEALVMLKGLHVVLTQRRRPFHNLEDFTKFGIDPSEARMVVVKSGYLSPQLAPIANPAVMALSEGAVNQAIERLDNRRRPKPSYPFERDFDFTPTCRLSTRAGGRNVPQRC